jgi:PTS system nitrogen regulatory IIA component
VNFESLDDEPVDLVFLLLAPTDAAADHLKALAWVARVFRDEALCRALREAANPGLAHDLLTGRREPRAA